MPPTPVDSSIAQSFRPGESSGYGANSPVVDMADRRSGSVANRQDNLVFNAAMAGSIRNIHEDLMLSGFSLEERAATANIRPQSDSDARDGKDQDKSEANSAAHDDSSETITADGTKVRTGPSGVSVEYPDGKTETTDPEGRVTTEYPKEVKNKDGTVTRKYPYDGRSETSGYDADDPREKETEYPNGRKETEFKDGHKETKFEQADPEKRESETVSKDGHVTTTKFRDGHTEQVDDRTGDIVKSYPPKDGKPGYNVTIHKGQDGTTSVETGAYEELKAVK